MILYDFTRYLPSQNLNLSVWRFREILVTLKCQILPKNAFDPIVVINVKSDITYNRCGHVVRDFESEAKTRYNF